MDVKGGLYMEEDGRIERACSIEMVGMISPYPEE